MPPSTGFSRAVRWCAGPVATVVLATWAGSLGGCSDRTAGETAPIDLAAFRDPPASSRPWVRWWWPGADVEADAIRADLEVLRDAGYGGVEVQPFAVGLDPGDDEPEVRAVGGDRFFAALAAAVRGARDLGLGIDVNFGSGWPMGGPFVAATERQLLASSVDVVGPSSFSAALTRPGEPEWVALSNTFVPVIGTFDAEQTLVAVVAARLDASTMPPTLGETMDLGGLVVGETLAWEVPPGSWRIFAVYENTTSHFVVGGAYPGRPEEARVSDHLSATGAQEFIDGFGRPMLDALGDARPDGIFIDSFELLGDLPWTPDLAAEIARHAGYDVTPYLPFLFRAGGESTYAEGVGEAAPLYPSEIGERAREDYEDARAALFHEGFLGGVVDWSRTNGLELRLQAHGSWGDVLDDYALADVPESEGLYAAGHFDFLKLASSAAHTAGRDLASMESFVAFVPRPGDPAVEDLYLLAGRALSAGINRLVEHGHPYPRTSADGSRWYPFELSGLPFIASSRLFPGSARWGAIPALNEYVARVQHVMSQGKHRADVARLSTQRRFENRFFVASAGFPAEEGESATSLALKRAGLVYDWVSRAALARAAPSRGELLVGAARYAALVVEDLETATVDLLTSIESIADAGVPVLLAGGLPRRARGLRDAATRDRQVAEINARLASKVLFWDEPSGLARHLEESVPRPSVFAPDGELPYAVDRRALAGGEALLLFNERGVEGPATLALDPRIARVTILDPATGEARVTSMATPPAEGGPSRATLAVDVPPRRCLVLLLEVEPAA